MVDGNPSFNLDFYVYEGGSSNLEIDALFAYNYAPDGLLNFRHFWRPENYVKRIYYEVQTLPEMNRTTIFNFSNGLKDIAGFTTSSCAVFFKQTYAS